MNNFPKRLTQLRENRELSKKQLAEILHVSDSCISQYENGKSMPGYDTLLSIAQFFAVSIDFLLGNENKETHSLYNKDFCNNVSFHQLMIRCNNLTPARRKALLQVIDALQTD